MDGSWGNSSGSGVPRKFGDSLDRFSILVNCCIPSRGIGFGIISTRALTPTGVLKTLLRCHGKASSWASRIGHGTLPTVFARDMRSKMLQSGTENYRLTGVRSQVRQSASQCQWVMWEAVIVTWSFLEYLMRLCGSQFDILCLSLRMRMHDRDIRNDCVEP